MDIKALIKKTYFIFFVLTFLVFIPNSFSYFNALSSQATNNINIGTWNDRPHDLLNYFIAYVQENYPRNSDDLLELMTTNKTGLKFLYENYKMAELTQAVDLLNDFEINFLTRDESGQSVFIKDINEPVTMPSLGLLQPGENTIIKQFIQTAQYSQIPWYSALTLQLIIESPHGEDISDFSVEVLIDSKAFSRQTPFSYNYLLVDDISYNRYRAQSTLISQTNTQTQDWIEFNTQISKKKDSKYLPTTYLHSYEKPSLSGDWIRFQTGPNYYLSEPVQTAMGMQQEFVTNGTREGLILIGRPNGSTVELRINIPVRNPYEGDNLPVIPISFIVSRGLLLDDDGGMQEGNITYAEARRNAGNLYNVEYYPVTSSRASSWDGFDDAFDSWPD